MGSKHGPIEERFWAKVSRTIDGCWEWQGTRHRQGYGQLQTNHRTEKAHRVSWQLCFGPIPDGMDVLHHCDNPPCVRPSHLFLGDHEANMHDMIRKDRLVPLPGERNGLATLSNAQATEIRTLYAAGEDSQRSLARRFGVSQTTIWKIVTDRTYVA